MGRHRHMRVWGYVDEVARAGSFRRAAGRLNITPTALQRRIQDVEEDFGAPVFERRPDGVRLTSAGETLIRWIRSQAADLDRVQQQIEDLSGLRGGVVRVGCSQALAQSFLPEAIADFTRRYPRVRFVATVQDHGQALRALRDYEADLALVLRPARHPEFQPLMTLGQRLVAIMAAAHPLATHEPLRLRDCAAYPLALPDRTFAGRQILDEIVASSSITLDAQLEANSFELLRAYVRHGRAITFQIEIGAAPGPPGEGLIVRPLDDRDLAHGFLVLGQLRGRTLPPAAATFADQLAKALDGRRTLPTVPDGAKDGRVLDRAKIDQLRRPAAVTISRL